MKKVTTDRKRIRYNQLTLTHRHLCFLGLNGCARRTWFICAFSVATVFGAMSRQCREHNKTGFLCLFHKILRHP